MKTPFSTKEQLGCLVALLLSLAPMGCSTTQSYVPPEDRIVGSHYSVTIRVARSSSMLGALNGMYVVDCDGLPPNAHLDHVGGAVRYFEIPKGVVFGEHHVEVDHDTGKIMEAWRYRDLDGLWAKSDQCPGSPVTVVGSVAAGGTLEWKRKPGPLHLVVVASGGGFGAAITVSTTAGETHVFKCGYAIPQTELTEVK